MKRHSEAKDVMELLACATQLASSLENEIYRTTAELPNSVEQQAYSRIGQDKIDR